MNISHALGSDLASVLTALSLLVTSLASLTSVFVSLRNSRKIEVVRNSTNGLKDELVLAAREAASAAGYIKGKKEGRRAQKEDDGKPHRPKTKPLK